MDDDFLMEIEVKEDFMSKKKYISLTIINKQTGEIRIKRMTKYIFSKIFGKQIFEEFNINYFEK